MKSRISDVKKRLPPDSLYMPIEEHYLFRQGNSQRRLKMPIMVGKKGDANSVLGTAMPTEVYARKVVSDLLKPAPKAWLWRGHQASVARWLSWLLPSAFWVSDSCSWYRFCTDLFFLTLL